MPSEKDPGDKALKMPRFEDLQSDFETALQKPESRPIGFREKLIHATKRLYNRMTNYIQGMPGEYETEPVFLSLKGNKYKFDHIKDGIKESQTTVLGQGRRSGDDILRNEIRVTSYPDEKNPQKQIVQSRHDLEMLDRKQTEILTDGVTLSNGESLSRTRNFETGETTFRKNNGGLFQEWTFNGMRQLISSYEGRFGEPGKPDLMSQFNYTYTPDGKLSTAIETRTTITSEGETTQMINHPISAGIAYPPIKKASSR